MSDIIGLIYHHHESQPSPKSALITEREMAFSTTESPSDIHHARPMLSTWATRLVGNRAHDEVGKLTQNDPEDPDDCTQLRASSNGRRTDAKVVTWDDLGRYSIADIAEKYKRRAPLTWYLTESMAGPRKNGVVVTRQRRSHPTIQVGSINAFIMARNRYATGLLGMTMGVWQFACKAHIDVKRVWCRLGYSIHDTTTRDVLDSCSDDCLSKLRLSVADGINQGEMRYAIIMDNVQQFCRQREEGLGRQDVLKCGTAATAILLDDCAPGAFDLKDHLDRVVKKERATLTTQSLYDSIDWKHAAEVQALHWVRILVEFAPELQHLKGDVSKRFRGDGIAVHRMREGRKTVVQPLGTNSERETETQGMMRAMLDFEKQMGLDEKAMEGKILLHRGDGASIAAMGRIKQYLSAHPNDYKAFRNRLPPGPEVWHTRYTEMSSIASNHYGPAASNDPSSLSKSAVAANMKRPANLKKPDFYPTARSMTLFFEARVLDCWRMNFAAEDLLIYIKKEDKSGQLPDLEGLLVIARNLVRRYASQQAYERALAGEDYDTIPAKMQVPKGTLWTTVQQDVGGEIGKPAEELINQDINNPEMMIENTEDSTRTGEKIPDSLGDEGEVGEKTHIEAKDFKGDRVLANEALVLEDLGWWIEGDCAVPEGDMGRVLEVMMIWIFNFCGGSNKNYVAYLLEMYCLLRYEASKDLSNAILNNMLVNLTGRLGGWIEGDLMQEHYNLWLEEMVENKGGEFDDKFYRQTLAPNVHHFLRIKENIEKVFDLKPRSKTHGARHLDNELLYLLRMYKEDELHAFRSGRTMGHAAVNRFDRGYKRLEEGRLASFLAQSTAYADVVGDVQKAKEATNTGDDGVHGDVEESLTEAITREESSSEDEDDVSPSISRRSSISVGSRDEGHGLDRNNDSEDDRDSITYEKEDSEIYMSDEEGEDESDDEDGPIPERYLGEQDWSLDEAINQ